MKAQYQIKFQSEEQREAFEELLMSMGVAFREVESSGVEEPETDYQTVDPSLLELTEQDKLAIDRAIEAFERGEYVDGSDVLKRLEDRIVRLKNGL